MFASIARGSLNSFAQLLRQSLVRSAVNQTGESAGASCARQQCMEFDTWPWSRSLADFEPFIVNLACHCELQLVGAVAQAHGANWTAEIAPWKVEATKSDWIN